MVGNAWIELLSLGEQMGLIDFGVLTVSLFIFLVTFSIWRYEKRKVERREQMDPQPFAVEMRIGMDRRKFSLTKEIARAYRLMCSQIKSFYS